MTLDLTDAQTETLLTELDHITENDRYFLWWRILTLKEIHATIRPIFQNGTLCEFAGPPLRSKLQFLRGGQEPGPSRLPDQI